MAELVPKTTKSVCCRSLKAFQTISPKMQMKEVNREGIFEFSVTVMTSYWSHNIAVCPHSSQLSVYSLCGLVISVEQITKKLHITHIRHPFVRNSTYYTKKLYYCLFHIFCLASYNNIYTHRFFKQSFTICVLFGAWCTCFFMAFLLLQSFYVSWEHDTSASILIN